MEEDARVRNERKGTREGGGARASLLRFASITTTVGASGCARAGRNGGIDEEQIDEELDEEQKIGRFEWDRRLP